MEADAPDERASREFAARAPAHLDAAFALARWLTGSRADAQDAVQDACVRALRGMGGWSGANFRAWFLAIVRNAALDGAARRNAGPLRFVGDPEAAERGSRAALARAAQTPDAESRMIARTDREAVRRAVAALPAPFREAVLMRDLSGLSYREIAEATGAPQGTVMSRIARGRALLAEALVGDPDHGKDGA